MIQRKPTTWFSMLAKRQKIEEELSQGIQGWGTEFGMRSKKGLKHKTIWSHSVQIL